MISGSLMLLALAAPPVTAVAPAPPIARAVTEAKSDADVWTLARRADSIGGYESYLRRFPAGAHRAEAVERWYRLSGLPPQAELPAAPPSQPGPTNYTTYADPCVTALGNPKATTAQQAEAAAFAAMRRDNRLADYKSYLRDFPKGICAPAAEEAIRLRALRGTRFPAIPGFGPLAPQARTRSVISADDYPAAALRAEESGDVTAAWDVAKDGVVESCRVIRSSGSVALDAATCRIITSRIRYDPARDAAGNAIPARDSMWVRWQLEDSLPPEPIE